MQLLTAWAAVSPAVAGASTDAPLPRPDYEQRFNVSQSDLKFFSGAKLGGPATGVSGKLDDLAYIGVPTTSENPTDAPRAISLAPISAKPRSAFSCMFWYYLDENGPDLQVPLNTGDVMYMLKPEGFEIRIQQTPTPPHGTTFSPGHRGPHLPWRETGRWIFVAFTWEQEGHLFSVYQGTHIDRVMLMRTMKGRTPTEPTMPRDTILERPEVIGGNLQFNRPLVGRLDNIRQFDHALTEVELEAIRLADLANAPLNKR